MIRAPAVPRPRRHAVHGRRQFDGKSGDYTVFLKMPYGYKIAPHWRPKWENVTVISANFKVDMGRGSTKAKMMISPAGSFA